MMTIIANKICSEISFIGFSFLILAMLKFRRTRSSIPQAVARKRAVSKGKSKMGIAKVKVKPETERKAKRVVSQISFGVCLPLPFSTSASSAVCKLTASDKPSAMAITTIPATTANFEEVAECIPTIIPRDVITAVVRPKEIPVIN
ncbi:MAG: hypothetical protein GWN17_06925 [Candidatus Korarchaeota archaeon]|nr:hypothetical protein [Candidatus Korarchaeota archaeon]